ncbi:DUF3631 domain-containing protein [Paraburkholderia sp. J10-1]|uniref:DUF3631 domain-containing protein n=1 Tax=Paraburkholderia sp. J10-1 TaxID=2805430 RepID=UPI002AB64DE2|nr:DUF3631 domain-containing protein [Paraburkholderia sp. J10-1]
MSEHDFPTKIRAGEILDRLDGVRQTGPNQWVACCPAHDDRDPSLSISAKSDGEVLLHCHAGCDFRDVLRGMGFDSRNIPRVVPLPEANRKRQDATREMRAKDAATKAVAILAKATPARSDHPYLLRKGVRAVDALREIDSEKVKALAGYAPKVNGESLRGRLLVVPVYVEGKLATVELIDEVGNKSALANGTKAGGFWAVVPLPPDAARIVIAEGVATALSIHEATALPTVAALSCGQLLKVAKSLRAQHHGAALLVAGDLGNGQSDAEKAAKAVNGYFAFPDFGVARLEDQTDFNDLHQAHGLDVVRAQLESALVAHAKPDTAKAPTDESDAQNIARLAKFTAIEYERSRADAAERLGIRPSLLDKLVKAARDEAEEAKAKPFEDVEPHAEPVNGEAMLNEIAKVIRRFVVADSETIAAVALWVVTTWFAEVLHVAPILLIDAPEKACGKTQLLTVAGRLVPRPAIAAGISPSALFRMVEKYTPTLLIDEIETVLTREAEELRGLLNSGHTRDSAYVWRSVPVGDEWEPRRFATFGFKALSGINAHRLAETITSRSIVATLRKKLKDERADKLRRAEPGLFEMLRAMLARWRDDNIQAIREADPDIPEALGDRDGDNWESLLCVADVAGGRWPQYARQAALKLCDTSGEQAISTGTQLMNDIREVYARKNTDRLHSHELVSALRDLEESPWNEWGRGRGLSVRNLSTLLSEYKVASHQIKIAGENRNGYYLSQFDDVFKRYLSV